MISKLDWYTYKYRLRRRELKIFFFKFPKKIFKEVLELGAGDGFQSTILTNYASRLISTDINPDLLAKKSTNSIEYRICDAEEFENIFKEKQFDFIFSSNLLEHLPYPQKALNSIYNKLKDDGLTIHVMPNPLWKIINLVSYIPYNILRILKSRTNKTNNKRPSQVVRNKNNDIKRQFGNNPKIIRKKKSRLYRLFIQKIHGASSNHLKELYDFSRFRWKKEFKKANFEIIKIINGIVSSGYGFRFNYIREILEKIGISTEYIYIAKKKGKESAYTKYI